MKSHDILINRFVDNHSVDVVKILESSDINDVREFLCNASIEVTVDLLTQMELSLAVDCIEKIDQDRILQLFTLFPSSTSELLLRRVSSNIKDFLYYNLDGKIINPIKLKLTYEETMVGAKMNTDIVTIPEDISIDEAFNTLKKQTGKIFNYLFIVDRNKKLIGITEIENLLIENSSANIASLAEKEFPSLNPNTQLHSILNHPGWNQYSILPVLNHEGILLGLLEKKDIQGFFGQKKEEISDNFINTSNALAELFKIGLTSVLSGGRIKQK